MNRFVEYRTEVFSVSQVRRHRKISSVWRGFVTAKTLLVDILDPVFQGSKTCKKYSN